MSTTATSKLTRHIGPNIKRAREKAGMTQIALAHAIGRTGDDAGAAICRIEASQHEPRLDTLGKIAAALKVSLDSLLARPKRR